MMNTIPGLIGSAIFGRHHSIHRIVEEEEEEEPTSTPRLMMRQQKSKRNLYDHDESENDNNICMIFEGIGGGYSYNSSSVSHPPTSQTPPPPPPPYQISDIPKQILFEQQGYSLGLIECIESYKSIFASRIFIIDNSLSMNETIGKGTTIIAHEMMPSTKDGSSRSTDRFVEISKWDQLCEGLNDHIRISSLCNIPTYFRFINEPAKVGCQQFQIAMKSSNKKTDKNGGRPIRPPLQQFHTGSSNKSMTNNTGGGVDESTNNGGGAGSSGSSSSSNEVQDALQILDKVQPSGHKPLMQQLHNIYNNLRKYRHIVEEYYQEYNKYISFVITTDGLPTDEYGKRGSLVQLKCIDFMRKFNEFPVGFVFRIYNKMNHRNLTNHNNNNSDNNKKINNNNVNNNSNNDEIEMDDFSENNNEDRNNNNNNGSCDINGSNRSLTLSDLNSSSSHHNNKNDKKDESELVSYYYRKMKQDLSHILSIEIVHDWYDEALEVYAHNPWFVYSKPVHRIREMGYNHEIFDLLSTRQLHKGEVFNLCILIFGKQYFVSSTTTTTTTTSVDCFDNTTTNYGNSTNDSYGGGGGGLFDNNSASFATVEDNGTNGGSSSSSRPLESNMMFDPFHNWAGFLLYVERLQRKEKYQWCPILKKMRPWIDISKLSKLYGETKMQRFRRRMRKHKKKLLHPGGGGGGGGGSSNGSTRSLNYNHSASFDCSGSWVVGGSFRSIDTASDMASTCSYRSSSSVSSKIKKFKKTILGGRSSNNKNSSSGGGGGSKNNNK